MILRLDPTVPIVWRSPTTVQLGVDPVICVFDGASAATERLLAALTVGAPESALPVVAETAGAGVSFAYALLEAVRPALLPSGGIPAVPHPATRSPALLRVAVHGGGAAARQFGAVIDALGATLVSAIPDDGARGADDADDADATVDAAVLFGSYAIAPARHGVWLRRDVPHLGVTFGERSARVGPFVEPGVGPCLACVDLARGDADPAWPVVASQLTAQRAAAESDGGFTASVCLRVARIVLDRLLDGSREFVDRSLELRTDGGERTVSHPPHARCGCRALPEIAMADVLPLDRFRAHSRSAASAAAPA